MSQGTQTPADLARLGRFGGRAARLCWWPIAGRFERQASIDRKLLQDAAFDSLVYVTVCTRQGRCAWRGTLSPDPTSRGKPARGVPVRAAYHSSIPHAE